MKTLAYVPGLERPTDLDGSVECVPSRYWDGRTEECESVAVHPHCRRAHEILAAYQKAGTPVIDWDSIGRAEQKPVEISGISDGMWAGQDVVIVGGGPSLKGFDFRRLRDFPCKIIAINRAYEFLDDVDLFFAMDGPFIQKCEAGGFGEGALAKWAALDVPMITPTMEAQSSQFNRLTWLPRGSANKLSRSLKDGIHTGRNSGFGALHLATILGAERIFLLGYDCAPTDDGLHQHWHDGYPDLKHDKDSVYQRFLPAFEQHAEELNKRAEIINCNPDSAIKGFAFGDLPDGPLHPKAEDVPVIACFVTPDYRKVFADYLKPSLESLCLAYELVEMPDAGSWQKNCALKPKAIQQVRTKHPGRPVAWLDADAKVERLPSLFAALADRRVDVAAHRLPSGELLSGTLFFGSEPIADVLIADWQKRCETEPEKYRFLDQRHLDDVLKAIPDLITEALPASYCKIFDRADQPCVHPAIVHYQASRQMKKGKKRVNTR